MNKTPLILVFVLLSLFVPGASMPLASQAAPISPQADHADEGVKIVIAGHLYSLFVQTKTESPDPLIGWRAPLRTFVEDVSRSRPDAVFLLGDSVRYGKPDEWAFVRKTLMPIWDRTNLIPGNHEYRKIDAFKALGGQINKSIVVGGSKFVLLDCKMVFEAHDLEFIRQEMLDASEYDHVFILMHYLLALWPVPDVPLEQVDPYEEYTRKSNWNRDVVPLIAGKVDAVFTGDFVDNQIQTHTQDLGALSVLYVSSSFRFGRGRRLSERGDGPMTYLELRIKGTDFEIKPRIVGLDVRDPWYQVPFKPAPNKSLPPIPGVTKRRYPLGKTGLSLELSFEWDVKPSKGRQLEAMLSSKSAWKTRTLEYQAILAEPSMSATAVSKWRSLVAKTDGAPLNLEDRPALTILPAKLEAISCLGVGIEKGKKVSRLSVAFVYAGRVHVLSLTGPASERGKNTKLMLKILRTLEKKT